MNKCKRYFEAVCRKKTIDPRKLLVSRFERNLNKLDLLGIGISGSLGIGVYVVITYVIKHQAGPSAVISVIIAGVAAILSGLCYSEFATRLPKAGSSYIFIYATLGELSAFVNGWSMVIENTVLAASAAKAWSQYFDGLLNNSVRSYLDSHAHWKEVNGFESYPDVLSIGILLLTWIIFLCGTKVSRVLIVMLTIFNVFVVSCIICVGFFHVQHDNWIQPPGFFPFGVNGITAGAATIFSVFAVIDTVCSVNEETKEPLKIVPSAVLTTNILTSVLIICVSAALTLAFPWYQIQDTTGIPQIFHTLGINGSFTVFSIGGLIGLTAGLLSCVQGIPRLLYSMKMDRLLYPCWLSTSKKPVMYKLIILPLILSCLLSVFVTLNMLIQMLAVGTLISHTFIAICVVSTRYQPVYIGLHEEYESLSDKTVLCTEFVYASLLPDQTNDKRNTYKDSHDDEKKNFSIKSTNNPTYNTILSGEHTDSTFQKRDSVICNTTTGSQSSLFQLPHNVSLEPTNGTSSVSSVALVVFVLAATLFSSIMTFESDLLLQGTWWTTSFLLSSVIIMLTSTIVLVKQPQNQTSLYYKTPHVPFVPLLSIFMNTIMMASLSYKAWLRYSIGLCIGLIVYFSYGFQHSVEKETEEQEVVLYDINESESTHLK